MKPIAEQFASRIRDIEAAVSHSQSPTILRTVGLLAVGL
jgi:hypothetical protein